MHRAFLSFFALTVLTCSGFAQPAFTINGSAVITGNRCVQLTPEQDFVVGTIWANQQISLFNPFDIQVEMYFGDNDVEGADGMTFALQPVSTSVGNPGEGLGIGGVTPSLAVEFDTFENGYDPAFDHLALVRDGNVDHFSGNTLFGPVPISASSNNVENNQSYLVRISWNPTAQNIKVYVNCDLRMDYTFPFNVVNTIFNGGSFVYWGFTGATGGFNNIQSICLVNGETTFQPERDLCIGDSITLDFPGGSTYSWSPTTDLLNANSSSPTFFPQDTITYIAQITDSCGNSWNDSVRINAIPPPQVALGPDTTVCENTPFQLAVSGNASSYSWSNNTTGNTTTFTLSGSTTIWVEGITSSCTSGDTISVGTVTPLNEEFTFDDTTLCIGDTLYFPNPAPAQVPGNPYTAFENTTDALQLESQPDSLWFTTSNACGSHSDTALVYYESVPTVIMPMDTTVCEQFLYTLAPIRIGSSSPYTLRWNTGDTTFSISPLTYGSGTFTLETTNRCGTSSATTNIDISPCYPEITVPNIFTPNSDGVNDFFVPLGLEDRNFNLTILNRWGMVIFETDQPARIHWNGRTNSGEELPDGTYFYVLTEQNGEATKKGTVTLQR